MPAVTAAEFNSLMDLSTADLPLATGEDIINLAIQCIDNLGGLEISTLSGSAGSKTLSVSDSERAAIMYGARAIYYGFYRGVSTLSMGGISLTVPMVLENSEVRSMLQTLANNLKEQDWSGAFL